jgi:hypothetical protein
MPTRPRDGVNFNFNFNFNFKVYLARINLFAVDRLPFPNPLPIR